MNTVGGQRIATNGQEWERLAARGRARRRATTFLLYGVLVVTSLPILVP